ncbi:sigma-70 family RNA polymerase sigma factor [Botrimarina hoheduenensis]|uniref:RNA polymerase sigma factor CarQ n=1 Tax=Botrimarina hoheduenensis TaxID=2528000 RepID=A0A5C5WCT5_9BACT|nr:sigma-70 family RNA polymerase sigma factor [Botrimarina hoheduenensis]TWT47849.1 RNA polymerase sigma factor CarQ [Botrimarina hoheduenensis]
MSRSDHREQFLALLSEHEAQLMGFLCAVAPNYQDAEDLLQQTVLTMWQKFDQYEIGTSFVAWGRQIARYKAMNLLQSRRLTPLDADVIDLLIVSLDEQEPEQRVARRRALSGCLSKLPADDRRLVEVAYAGEQSIKEIAATIDRSAGGVYNSLARIRAALLKCIQSTLAQEGFA